MTDPDPPPRRPDDPADPGVRRLGDALKGVVSSLRPDAGESPRRLPSGAPAASLGGLFRGWEQAVGPQVAQHAQPLVLDGGRLVVEVDQGGWATQLRFLEQDLLDRVRPLVAPAPLTSLEVRVKGARKARGNRKT